MSARRRTYRLPVVMIPLAAIVVAVGAPIAADAQTSSAQALMIGSTWSGWINQAQVVQTALTTGGIAAQISIRTNYVGSPLMTMIEYELAGKPLSTTLQLSTYTSTGSPVSLFKITGPRIQEVDLPAADARNIDTALVGVKFVQAPVELAKPAAYPPQNPISQILHAPYFRLQFDTVVATTAITVAPMTVLLPGIFKGIVPQLVLTYALSTTLSGAPTASAQAFDQSMQTWLQSQTTKSGTLTFFASDFKTPLLVERFSGLRVTSITGTTTRTAMITMTGIRVGGAVTP